MGNKIYKISNTVNHMVYVGFTDRTLKDRFDSHRRDANKKLHIPLYAAMNEYGFDKFIIELIEELPVHSTNLYRREQYWIDCYDSAYPNGYNADSESLKRLRGVHKLQLLK